MATDKKVERVGIRRYTKLSKAIHGIFKDHVGYDEYRKMQKGIHKIFANSGAVAEKK